MNQGFGNQASQTHEADSFVTGGRDWRQLQNDLNQIDGSGYGKQEVQTFFFALLEADWNLHVW